MSTLDATLLSGQSLYREVILRRVMAARESVWISTANVKAMMVERRSKFVPVVEVFAELASRGVELRLLHAEKPSRPFREAMEKNAKKLGAPTWLRTCPRVHFKTVLVDKAWVYLGSANLTGAGLGAKDEGRRNFEIGFVTEDYDVIDNATAMFEAIWSGAECAGCKLRGICPKPLGPGAVTTSRRLRVTSGLTLGKARKLPRMCG